MKSIILTLAAAAATVFAQPGSRSERVRFAKGASSTSINGQLKGHAYVDYLLRAGAGQTLAVTLKKSNPQNYFNILPPGSKDVAMYVGQTGKDYKGVLPIEGDYTIRVYLMRPAARRNESSNYTLTVAITGKPLPPVSAAKDALIPGTPFHARGTISCAHYLEPKPQKCEASVIRRSFDGTATVVVRFPNGWTRRVLFVKGKPSASDSQNPITFELKGDITVIKFGEDERVDIPEALVVGG